MDLPPVPPPRARRVFPATLAGGPALRLPEGGLRQAPPEEGVKKESTSTAQLCDASLSFWLAHMAVGIVSSQQVACHIFLLLRASEDYNSDYAILYHGRLMAGLRQRISMGENFDIGGAISRIDTNVFCEVDHKRSSGWEPPPRDQKEKPGKGKGKGEKASGESTPAPDPPARPTRGRGICFSHDPADKKVCRTEKCQREHLDTNLSENKARFPKAQTAFEENKKQRRKGAASV